MDRGPADVANSSGNRDPEPFFVMFGSVSGFFKWLDLDLIEVLNPRFYVPLKSNLHSSGTYSSPPPLPPKNTVLVSVSDFLYHTLFQCPNFRIHPHDNVAACIVWGGGGDALT